MIKGEEEFYSIREKIMNIYLISFLIIYYLKYQSLYYNIIKTSKRLFFLSLDQIIIYNFRSLDKSLWKIF